jgi:hypothetical protein
VFILDRETRLESVVFVSSVKDIGLDDVPHVSKKQEASVVSFKKILSWQ